MRLAYVRGSESTGGSVIAVCVGHGNARQGDEYGSAELTLAFCARTSPIPSGQVPSCSFPPLSKPALGENSLVQEMFSWCIIQVWSSRFLHSRHAQFPESPGGKVLKISRDFENIFKIVNILETSN